MRPAREESHIVVRKLMDSVGADGEISCHREQRNCAEGCGFCGGGFSRLAAIGPVPSPILKSAKLHGLEQTIADTLGPAESCAHYAPFRTCGAFART